MRRNSEFITHTLYLVLKAQQQEHYYCRVYGSQKCPESFNSLVTGQTATDSANFFASSMGWAQATLVVRYPPAARSLAITGACVVFRSGVINLQLAVCAEEFEIRHMYEVLALLIEARQLLLFVRLAKMSRVFNRFVTGQIATDSALFFS